MVVPPARFRMAGRCTTQTFSSTYDLALEETFATSWTGLEVPSSMADRFSPAEPPNRALSNKALHAIDPYHGSNSPRQTYERLRTLGLRPR